MKGGYWEVHGTSEPSIAVLITILGHLRGSPPSTPNKLREPSQALKNLLEDFFAACKPESPKPIGGVSNPTLLEKLTFLGRAYSAVRHSKGE